MPPPAHDDSRSVSALEQRHISPGAGQFTGSEQPTTPPPTMMIRFMGIKVCANAGMRYLCTPFGRGIAAVYHRPLINRNCYTAIMNTRQTGLTLTSDGDPRGGHRAAGGRHALVYRAGRQQTARQPRQTSWSALKLARSEAVNRADR